MFIYMYIFIYIDIYRYVYTSIHITHHSTVLSPISNVCKGGVSTGGMLIPDIWGVTAADPSIMMIMMMFS